MKLRIEYWKMVKRESDARGDEARARTSDFRIGEAMDDMYRCDAKKEEYRQKIRELERLEDKVEPYLQ